MGDGTKGLLRLTPVVNGATDETSDTDLDAVQPDTRKPIDIVYIRAEIDSKLEDFEVNTDVGSDGNPLPKVLLFKAENLGVVNMMQE